MVAHDINLTGPRFAGSSHSPLILERTDQDFVSAILEQLVTAPGRDELLRQKAATRVDREPLVAGSPTGARIVGELRVQQQQQPRVVVDRGAIALDSKQLGVVLPLQPLRLFHPVQRTFYVVLAEIWCETPGSPRLDPGRIQSAGMVIRRGRPSAYEGWMKDASRFKGWMGLSDTHGEDADPAVERRVPRRRSGYAAIDEKLAELARPSVTVSEVVAPMFVAPPDVCLTAGATILYGLVPLASSERTDELPPRLLYEPDDWDEIVQEHLSPLLKSASERHFSGPGQALNAASLASASGHNKELKRCVEQLVMELDAFGTSTESTSLRGVLDEIQVSMVRGSRPAGDVFEEIAEVLGGQRTHFEMPKTWPALSASLRSRILSRIRASIEARLGEAQPGEGRFDAPGATYALRIHARVDRGDGCPAKLEWSDYSEPFEIAPWYETGNAPPVQIPLPDPAKPGFLQKLKPNASFVVPKSVFEALQVTSLGDLVDGKKGSGNGFNLDWICGFNIPIITLCAFIVLSVFLSLLNIIFFWLPFVKVCIPFPRK